MENMREYWAREAEMMRDKSAILGTRANNLDDISREFAANINKAVDMLDKNGVKFGLNRVRNVTGSGKFDASMWSIINDSILALKGTKTPAQGVQGILDNKSKEDKNLKGWTLDCAQYVQVVYLGACLLTDGETQFNKYINNLLKVKNLKRFELHSHGTIGVESKEFYTRGVFDDAFRLDEDPNLRSRGKTEAEVLQLAPVGSRITVYNFYLNDLLASKNKGYKEFADSVFWRGWGFENMIKIAPDRYAAFGVGKEVTLKRVREELLEAYYLGAKPSAKDKESVMARISISQVLTYQRS